MILKLLGTYQEEWEKQTINHDLYFFQLWVSMLLEHQVWMTSIVANFSEKLPVLFFFLLLSPRLASNHLLQSYISLQLHLASIFWEWTVWFSIFSFLRLILNPQPFFPLFFRLWGSVYSKFLISKWTFLFRRDRAALARSRNQ